MVEMVNLFPVNGYQFSINLAPGIVDIITAIDGTYLTTGGANGLTAQYGNGTVLGFDMEGTASIPANLEGQLLAVLVLSPQYTGSGDEVTATISDFVISGIYNGANIGLASCDTDLDPLNGCFSTDTFSTPTADCSGIPGGSLELDECGVCGGDGIADGACDCDGNVDLGCGCGEAAPSGCDNACGSTLENDECGVCGGDSTSCMDCAGVPNGTTVVDDCGVCGGGNADMDDCGVCNGDGSSCLYSVVQSTEQAIYKFDSVTLDGEGIGEGDWLIAKNNGITVGVSEWTGSGTEVVVMGEEHLWGCDEGPVNTCGFMNAGETPQFYVFDASAPGEFIAEYVAADGTQLQSIPSWNPLDFHLDVSLAFSTDCNDDLGGAAVTTGLCGDCWGGNTGLDLNYMDTDDDGVCNDGAANGDDDNCPDTSNNDQADNDSDEEGDACDSDDDNDGCEDSVDIEEDGSDASFTWDDDYDARSKQRR